MPDYFKADKLELVRSGEAYFKLLKQLIRDSRQIIHLQTYIFDDDRTGCEIIQELCDEARRGIKVYLLLDAFGSVNFKRAFQHLCLDAGVNFRFFASLFSNENIFAGRRLHHKLVSVDHRLALVGGINIAEKYRGSPHVAPWLDFALYSEAQDNVVLEQLCADFYFRRLNKREVHLNMPTKKAERSLCYQRNDWIRGRNEIHNSYHEQISSAKKEILIVASYFLPGRKFRDLLSAAVRRGVRVRLLIAGQSDTLSVRFAETYLYNYYLRNKIEIYEWKDSVMHGKAMITDQNWCTIGSYNLNFLSHFASIELNAECRDPVLIMSFQEELESTLINHCDAFKADEKRARLIYIVRFLNWMAYSFFRILRSLFAGITKRRKRHLF